MQRKCSNSDVNFPLTLLLMGKTGHGKSATGNSILGRTEFTVSSSMRSTTKDVKTAWKIHEPYDIKVVDGPGLMETDITEAEDFENACTNMTKALTMCNGGVHAFILVIKFPMKFTAEERNAVLELRQIFGENYFKEHGILVVAGGDQFQYAMEEEKTPHKSFKEWCREQDEDLFKECNFRIVLFNNRTKSEDEKEIQRNELFQCAIMLSLEKGLYTSENFEKYAKLRVEIIKQKKLPLLQENIQKEINFLAAGIDSLLINSSLEDSIVLQTRIDNLHTEIIEQGHDDKLLQSIDLDLQIMRDITEDVKIAITDKKGEQLSQYFTVLNEEKLKLLHTNESQWQIFVTVIRSILSKVGRGVVRGIEAVGNFLKRLGNYFTRRD